MYNSSCAFFGSDAERAMQVAFDQVFHGSQRAVCTLHVLKSYQRFLGAKAIPKDMRRKLRPYFCGLFPAHNRDDKKLGILLAEDDDDFDDRCRRMFTEVDAMDSNLSAVLKPYLTRIWEGMKGTNWAMMKENVIPADWKNNAAESANAKMRKLAEYKSVELVQFCEILITAFEVQQSEIDRLIKGVSGKLIAFENIRLIFPMLNTFYHTRRTVSFHVDSERSGPQN